MIKNHFISRTRDQLRFYRLSGVTFYDCINIIYQFIKPFLDKKKCLLLRSMEPLKTSLSPSRLKSAHQKCSNYSKMQNVFWKFYAKDQLGPELSPDPKYLWIKLHNWCHKFIKVLSITNKVMFCCNLLNSIKGKKNNALFTLSSWTDRPEQKYRPRSDATFYSICRMWRLIWVNTVCSHPAVLRQFNRAQLFKASLP